MSQKDNFPIIIGVGQVVDHWDGQDAKSAPHPAAMIQQAIDLALRDTGSKNIASNVDCAAFLRSFSDSLRHPFDPFGKIKNLPHAVLSQSDISPDRVIYSCVGGEQPQALVSELSEALFRGDMDMAVIAGGETTGALKAALKNRLKLDWSSEVDGPIEDRGASTDFISEYEIKNGLGLPPQTYAALEQALRARLGFGQSEYLDHVGAVFSRLSDVAAKNPYAQFPTARDAAFLAKPSKENYPAFDPYLKWHMAQDAVNQASALVLTTVGTATSLGISEDKWVYLHGYADVKDSVVSKRPDISHSDAINLALTKALASSRVQKSDIRHRDLYSCFPIVVLLAAEYLGLDPLQDSMTVTGGLPFFGGAGNNYSTHAIASLVETLRADKDAFGLILANGGFISKESVGIYSTAQPDKWTPLSSDAEQEQIDSRPDIELLNEDCEAVIEGYCVKQGRHGPEKGYVIARSGDRRVIANISQDHRATLQALSQTDKAVGQSVKIIHSGGKNNLVNPNKIGAPMSDDFLSRDFKYVELKRDGNVLEVTLNRPESYNALHSAAHFELAEIFDAFESDQDLWVAIITGTGEKAFCSGNDLKVTASGGDMSTPSSGFAGLCSRTNREKPIIAAINGVAMGGGLEIVLACDVALASVNASFALPEVKVGLFAAAGGVQRLTRQIGEKAAMELILTGRKIDAQEAAKLGLINSVSDENVMTAARALAQTIAGNSPTSIRASKRVLNAVDDLGRWDKALALSTAEIVKLMQTKDCREGVTAFAQKRKPNWVNG
ncbi:MAG: enoyl-CoA hydratase-related protein [Hellea sp.]